jgi:hypothetical protein
MKPQTPPTELTQEQARIVLAFLQRVDLKGSEAPTFMHVASVLDAIANKVEAPADVC